MCTCRRSLVRAASSHCPTVRWHQLQVCSSPILLTRLFNDSEQVLTIFVLFHRFRISPHSVLIYPSVAECDFFEAADFQPLTLFDDFYEGRCFRKTVVCSCV